MKSNSRSLDFTGCQLRCIPSFNNGRAELPYRSVIISIKRYLAYPWNRYVKEALKSSYRVFRRRSGPFSSEINAGRFSNIPGLAGGDMVKVRSLEEIRSTLDPFGELKGCSFLPEMAQYCGTEQKVFRVMRLFMDERDYRMKKTRGIILLENIFCNGTAAFGQCDRSCFLFWREEWLQKL